MNEIDYKQNLSTSLCNIEHLALQSFKDFMSRRIEKFYTIVDAIGELSNSQDVNEEFISNLKSRYNISDNDYITFNGQMEKVSNLINNYVAEVSKSSDILTEDTFTSASGGNYTITEAFSSLNDIATSNIVLDEAMNAMIKESVEENYQASQSFFQNLNLRLSEINGTASQTASALNQVLDENNLSWKDKFQYIMNVTGLSNILINDNVNDLNFDSAMSQMSGTTPIVGAVAGAIENFPELPTIQQVGEIAKGVLYTLFVAPFELWWKGVTYVADKVVGAAEVTFNPNDIGVNEKHQDSCIDNVNWTIRLSFDQINDTIDRVNNFKEHLSKDKYLIISYFPGTIYAWLDKDNSDYFYIMVKLTPIGSYNSSNLFNMLEALEEEDLEVPILRERLLDILNSVNLAARNYSSDNETDVFKGIRSAKDLLYVNLTARWILENDVNNDIRPLWEGKPILNYYSDVPGTITNIHLAHELSGFGNDAYNDYNMVNGSTPVTNNGVVHNDERKIEGFVYSLLELLIDSVSEEHIYSPYVYSNTQYKGRLFIKTDQQNFDAFTSLIAKIGIATLIVATTILSVKVVHNLKIKALKTNTELSQFKSALVNSINNGEAISNEQYEEYYKLLKKTKFINNLTKGFAASASELNLLGNTSDLSFNGALSKVSNKTLDEIEEVQRLIN